MPYRIFSLQTRSLESSYTLPSDKIYLKPLSYYKGEVEIYGLKSRDYIDSYAVGKSRHDFSINLEAHHKLSNKSYTWGRASYSNEMRKSVMWNNSSDYDLIYPYIIVDSVGGNMKTETYSFLGGYATHIGKFTLGAEADYRAAVASRHTDPRPLNIISDLKARISLRRSITSRYGLSVGLEGGKYKQHSSIKLFGDKSRIRVHHYTGLGLVHSRYKADDANVYLSGYSWATKVAFTPGDTDGWMSCFSFGKEHITKSLDENGNLQPFELLRTTVKASVGRSFRRGALRHYYMVEGIYAKTTGKENLYGLPSTDKYPLIGSQEPYVHKQSLLSGLAACEYVTNQGMWEGTLKVAWEDQDEQYSAPFRQLGGDWLHVTVHPRYSLFAGKWTHRIGIKGMYRHTLTSNIILRNKEYSMSTNSIPELRYDRWQGSVLGITLEGTSFVQLKGGRLFLSPHYTFTRYAAVHSHTHEGGVTLGYVF